MWPHFAPGKSASTLEKLVVSGADAIVFATFTHTVADNGRAFRTPIAMHLVVVDDRITKMHLYEDTWVVSSAFF